MIVNFVWIFVKGKLIKMWMNIFKRKKKKHLFVPIPQDLQAMRDNRFAVEMMGEL